MNRHGTPPFIHSSPETIIIVINSNRSPNKLISDASPIISQGSYSCTGRGILRTIVQRSDLVSGYHSPAAFLPPPLTPTPPKFLVQFHRRIQSHPSLPTTHTIPRRRQCHIAFSRCDDTIPSVLSRCDDTISPTDTIPPISPDDPYHPSTSSVLYSPAVTIQSRASQN